LFISAYVEGSSWNKAVELYNGTGKTVDLSKYYLQKQSDGAGSFSSTLRLAGTLETGKTYTIVHKQATANLLAKANLVTDSLLQYNGNDAVALVRNGVTIDMAGKAYGGADVFWGTDLTLQRKSSVTHPVSVFNGDEWLTLPIDSYAMLGAHTMEVALTNVIVKDVFTGSITYPIDGLLPQNTYTYSVSSMRSGVIAPAINTMQLHTSALDVPEISDPSDVKYNSFTANWGASPYASGYLLNVFKVAGQADTTVVEGFDNVGSTGTPLPTGWTGNASGIYTTATSSGIASPSINLKTNKEWLQTKTYPHPISKFTFMYRIASASAGSSLFLEGLSNNNWIRLDSIPYKNTTKTYPVYNFTKEQAMSAFRFTYNKAGSGNIAIDDVSATYGSQDTVFVKKDFSVSANQAVVTELTENTNYFYAVRAALGTSISDFSESIGIKTPIHTKLTDHTVNDVAVLSGKNQVTVSGLRGNEQIQIYTLTGVCIYQTKASATTQYIPLKQSGIFILKIQNSDYRFTGKFIN